MKIEDITAETLMKATTPELRSLHVRCIQIYCRRFEENTAQRAEFKKHGEIVSAIERTPFLDNYGLLKQAMKARGIEVVWNHAIDKEFFRRAVRGLDVPSIGDIVVAKSYVSATGDFIRAPREAGGLEVIVCNENRDEELESKIEVVLKAATGKEPCFVYAKDGPGESHIPIFDLVLRARKETKQIEIEKEKKADKPKSKAKKKKTPPSKFDISKPSETNHVCVVGGGKYTRYRSAKRKSGGKTYTVRFGVRPDGKSEEYEYFYPVSEWTEAQARKHCKDHDGKKFEAAIKKAEEPILKFDILKVDKKQHIVGGIVYEPNAEDTQGDYTTAPEIQKAMYGFMEKYADNTNRIKVMHHGEAFQFPILESFQPEEDTKKGKHMVKAGAWWLMVKVTEPAIWAQIESGDLTGWSMGGTATA